jgi:hypothetical protein
MFLLQCGEQKAKSDRSYMKMLTTAIAIREIISPPPAQNSGIAAQVLILMSSVGRPPGRSLGVGWLSVLRFLL